MFNQKKTLDQMYRNMMWHFRHTPCDKCKYWDNVYSEHLANVTSHPQDTEISDADMLKAAMEIDGASE